MSAHMERQNSKTPEPFRSRWRAGPCSAANSVIFSQSYFNLTSNCQFGLGLRVNIVRKFHKKGNSTCAIYLSRLS